ncbi:MAG: hypothetical protein QOI20_29 [Acidimicrobiaceae bacterium]|jgi:hypothetical protein|nr:hypothetical protein [Acidimicrobiaceae bacterium]
MNDAGFRIAVLDQPAEMWTTPGASSLFNEMVSLKLAGYWNAYTASVLPVDGSDFYSTHYLVAEAGDVEGDRFPAVMGFRFTTLARCRQYNAPFPAVALCNAAGAVEHGAAVRALIEECDADGRTIAYSGSWTISPNTTADRVALRDLTIAGLLLMNKAFGIDVAVVGGTLRFKTDRLFELWGFEPMRGYNGPLAPIKVAHLGDEFVLLMQATEFSQTARAAADRWRTPWDDRLAIGPEGSPALR